MEALITGAAGFIGSHLAEEPLARGDLAAVARIKLDTRPGDAVLTKIAANPDEIIHVNLVELS